MEIENIGDGAKDPPIIGLENEKSRSSAKIQPLSISMHQYNAPEYQKLGDEAQKSHAPRKVSIIPLVFLIFYEVSGGPFGVEDSVRAAGPFLAIVGFIIFPFLWCIPEALITAELATMFPEDSGYVVWVSSALGPYCGFLQGWMKWLSGVIDNALYPVLFLDYLKSEIPILSHGPIRALTLLTLTFALTYMNYRGLTIVGRVAICLGVFSLLPFVVMGFISIPRLDPSRWFKVVDFNTINWSLYLNTLFWNYNNYDSISTLAGEVDDPRKTLPKALLYALILVSTGCLCPLIIGTGALPLDREKWTDGYYSEIGKIIGGVWLNWWIQGASALSNMGMFVTEMSTDSYQLLGMAERGMLPEFFAKRSVYGTPLIGIMFSSSGVILLSWMSFQEILAADNFLYCLGMLLEFLAFVRLRVMYPNASRPYKIPVGTKGGILMLIPPTTLILMLIALASYKVMVMSLGAVFVGCVLQPSLKFAEKKGWMKFSVSSELPDFRYEESDCDGEALID